jgi:hypothetical protein
MSVHEVMVSHIAAAKSELLSERVKIDAALGDLDRLLQQYASDDLTAANLPVAPATKEIAAEVADSADELRAIKWTVVSTTPSMRDAIKTLVQTHDGPIKADDAASILNQQYDWSKASVRSLLSKMAAAGDIAKVGRGLYDDVTHVVVWTKVDTQATGGEDAEAPVAAGASGSEEPSEGSSWKEGGSDYAGTEPPVGRDGSGDS